VVGIRLRPHGARPARGLQHVYADAIPDVEALEMPWLSAGHAARQQAESAELAIACLE
jgi:hypothetical protein